MSIPVWFYNDPVGRMHQEWLARDKRQKFLKPTNPNDYRGFERAGLAALSKLLGSMGWQAYPTANNEPFDLWVEGAKVEYKAARWRAPGRYQAAIRNHQADVLVFDCINGARHYHVIPMAQIEPRKSIAVWSYAPEESTGQWAGFINAWHYLEQAINEANHVWQPPLF